MKQPRLERTWLPRFARQPTPPAAATRRRPIRSTTASNTPKLRCAPLEGGTNPAPLGRPPAGGCISSLGKARQVSRTWTVPAGTTTTSDLCGRLVTCSIFPCACLRVNVVAPSACGPPAADKPRHPVSRSRFVSHRPATLPPSHGPHPHVTSLSHQSAANHATRPCHPPTRIARVCQ